MKNSVVLIFSGIAFIVCGFLAAKYWIDNYWLLLVPISGFALFVSGTITFIKKLEHEND